MRQNGQVLMRKLSLALLLPLLMLFAQQGALWHEIGHLSRGGAPQGVPTGVSADVPASASQQQQREQLKSLDKLCETCLAYAQLASVAKTDVLPLDLLSFGFGFARIVAVLAISADAPALRARGPPPFL